MVDRENGISLMESGRASIALEELGLPYTTHPIDIGKLLRADGY